MRWILVAGMGLSVLAPPRSAVGQAPPRSAVGQPQGVRGAAFRIGLSPDSSSADHGSKKSPGLAVALSTALPGLGQVYNGSYWKVPIIAGFGGWFVSRWVDNNDEYKTYRDLYDESIGPSLPSGNRQYKLLRDFYRDQRDKFAWYLGIVYLANIVDAFVDASLHDFNVSDDLSIRFGPTPRGVSLSVRF